MKTLAKNTGIYISAGTNGPGDPAALVHELNLGAIYGAALGFLAGNCFFTMRTMRSFTTVGGAYLGNSVYKFFFEAH